ncbi:hypothetical protein [Chryseolinea lacunae]|uniref:Adhesin domain-containing protein n=1 Tax=Chryseolinea lacunae TaxID=2801331 RepID=A0ABS1L0J4_9BACT|nr:hypothetical protein [Chryseolinea lacunae]MBL0745032.1 hypothetical protein [Chryseolinea lacunae]
MNKNILGILAALLLPLPDYAQTVVNKTVEAKPGQHVVMHFDYPELVRVSTWDKNEISIQSAVSINNGENDDAFEIFTSVSGNAISIRNEIKNMDKLPRRITIVDGAQKIVFKDKEELRKYQQEKGSANYDRMSYGLEMKIKIEVKVPRNFETRVESVYGMVEVKDFTGPLTIDATYGGVDAALTERAAGEVEAETNYGEIYTNFDAKFGSGAFKQGDFHTHVVAKPGTGPKYSFDSKYGNVYIRKSVQ